MAVAMTLRVLGLSGYAQTGKTTAARYIEQVYGLERRHIAEPLRRMLAAYLADCGVPAAMIPRYLTGDLKEQVIPQVGRSGRDLQISLGTEWGREQVGPDAWVIPWEAGVGPHDAVMNDSVRFPNEEAAVRRRGGVTILIRRKGTHPIAFHWGWAGRLLYRLFGCMWGVHPSERTDRLTPDHVIDNDGSLDELYRKLDRIMALEAGRRIGPITALESGRRIGQNLA